MFKNKKLAEIVQALQYSHPHYLGEEFYLSVSYDSERGFRAVFFMQERYKEFITDYCLEVFQAVSRLFYVNVCVKCQQGLPVVVMHTSSY